jgi:hypothetical protein
MIVLKITTKTGSVNRLNYIKRRRQRPHINLRIWEAITKFGWTVVPLPPHNSYPKPSISTNLKPWRMLLAVRSSRMMTKSPRSKNLVTSAEHGLHIHTHCYRKPHKWTEALWENRTWSHIITLHYLQFLWFRNKYFLRINMGLFSLANSRGSYSTRKIFHPISEEVKTDTCDQGVFNRVILCSYYTACWSFNVKFLSQKLLKIESLDTCKIHVCCLYKQA